MPQYDPWIDVNDDGVIDVKDYQKVKSNIPSMGTPINKTELLLELQSRMDTLNSSLLDLETYLNTRMTTLNTSLVELQSRVAALETRTPKKGYISVPPAAFTPMFTTVTYEKYPGYIRGSGNFLAPVQLPNGAIVTKMSVSLTDSSTTGQIEVNLIRAREQTNYYMANVITSFSGTPGQTTLFDDTIDYAQVDNQDYCYTLRLFFTYETNDLVLHSVFIEYEYPA
jgi:hypothetical protein